MSGTPPTLSLAWPSADLPAALGDGAARRDLGRQLPGYLRARRWFGGAARPLREARIERWIPLDRPGVTARTCLCVVAAADDDGQTTEHQVVLALGEPRDDGRRAVREGLEDGGCRALLFDLVLRGTRRPGVGADLVGERIEPPAADPRAFGEGRLLGVEQSNTSILFDGGAHGRSILKLYRRIERGPNPEVELGRFLTAEAGFAAVPPTLAIGRLAGPGGFAADALTVQTFVPNEGDGWAWALDRGRAALAGARSPGEIAAWLDREGVTLAGAAALGAVTARLHRALAGATDPELRPEPVGDEDVRRWAARLREEAAATAAALRRAGSPDAATLAAVERAGRLPAPAARNAGLKTRVHGDYHLGQVLKTADGFAILDFEGEPARTLAERRARQHPLLDVAGMARSWSYAAATVAREAPAGGSGEGPGTEVDREEGRLARAARWELAVRDRFLAAYWAEADRAPVRFLPAGDADRAALLRLFELYKALYEVRYELNYRPAWVAIPAAAVRALT